MQRCFIRRYFETRFGAKIIFDMMLKASNTDNSLHPYFERGSCFTSRLTFIFNTRYWSKPECNKLKSANFPKIVSNLMHILVYTHLKGLRLRV